MYDTDLSVSIKESCTNYVVLKICRCVCIRLLYTLLCLQIEIDSGKDLSEAYIMDEVHPQQQAYKPKFMKPPGPSGRRRSRSPGGGNNHNDN